MFYLLLVAAAGYEFTLKGLNGIAGKKVLINPWSAPAVVVSKVV